MVITSEIKGLIESNYVSLSTVGVDKVPHTIYVAYAKVKGDKIILTDNYMEKTKINLISNPNVSLSILVGEAGFELVGVAEYFSSGENLVFVKNLSENKGFPCKGAIVVNVRSIKKMG